MLESPALGSLAAGVVLVGVALKQNLGDGNDGVAIRLESLDDARQSLRRMHGGGFATVKVFPQGEMLFQNTATH